MPCDLIGAADQFSLPGLPPLRCGAAVSPPLSALLLWRVLAWRLLLPFPLPLSVSADFFGGLVSVLCVLLLLSLLFWSVDLRSVLLLSSEEECLRLRVSSASSPLTRRPMLLSPSGTSVAPAGMEFS